MLSKCVLDAVTPAQDPPQHAHALATAHGAPNTMVGRDSGRQRKSVNYSEREQAAASGGPAWLQSQRGTKSSDSGSAERQKENSRPATAVATAAAAAAVGAKPVGKASGKGRQSTLAAAERGRDAGLTRLPIEDAPKAPAGTKASGSGKGRSTQDKFTVAPAAAPGAKLKQVPGLPGVVVKAAPASTAGAVAAAAAAAKPTAAAAPKPVATAASKPAAAAASKPAAPKSGNGSKNAESAAPTKTSGCGGRAGASAAAANDGAAAGKPSSGSGKRKAAAAPADEASKPAPKPAPPAAAAATGSGGVPGGSKRLKAAAGAPQRPGEEDGVGAAAAAAAAAGPDGLLDGDAAAEAVVLAGSGVEALLEQYSTNFRELQAEYARLQVLYEDLKAAKIDEEVQALLEQQNKYVVEHGQKAAQLVEHYKAEAELQAALSTQLGGDVLLEQCHQLKADLMNCQQALLDQAAASLEKDKQIAEMQARLSYLERFARTYDTCDKCIQTDGPPQACASAQVPSLQSSGVEMLEAHALVPEGAGGGSIYKRPKAAAGQGDPDQSYTRLPAPTPPLHVGIAAAGPAAGAGAGAACPAVPAVGAATAAGASVAAAAAPISGSDMELTGEGMQQAQQAQHKGAAQPEQTMEQPQQRQLPQPQQQPTQQPQPPPQQPLQCAPVQQRRQSLQPVAGHVAHAAAGPAARPASAESQIQPGGAAAAAARQQQQRRMSMAGVAAGGAGAAAAAAGGRRMSAPPAPTDRELRFSSMSNSPGAALGGGAAGAGAAASLPLPLAAVPEEEPELQQPLPAEALGQAPAPNAAAQGSDAPPAAAGVVAVGAIAGTPGGGPAGAGGVGAGPTPASVPAPPRELAITALTGLASTPLKGGAYQFSDPATGYVFQLGPASPDSAALPTDGSKPQGELCYRPIRLGLAAAVLPRYLQEEIKFAESQRAGFMNIMMDALMRYRRQSK